MAVTTTELIINSVRLIDVDGQATIPTAVYYDDKAAHFGHEAVERAKSPTALIDDFKIALGSADPATLAKKRFDASGKALRSTLGIAKDFIESTLSEVISSLSERGLPKPNAILVAEPLSLDDQDKERWLTNYRKAVKQILAPYFGSVDFLPEPFAVFQYYRYGFRHPELAARRKHIALVMDFGGGTFDVCIVETTKEGDIKVGGRNSRPISAVSIPVGGFEINRAIAESLLFDAIDKDSKAATRRAIDEFIKTKEAGEFSPHHKQDFICFCENYLKLLREVERAKIYICTRVTNWDLRADLTQCPSYPINVPKQPFRKNPDYGNYPLTADRVRSIFSTRVWPRLKEAITRCIARSTNSLMGEPVTVALLSGGSSNIRWLRQLIEQDVPQLQAAKMLGLSESFQEIVAKGLSIECARRFYTESQVGDFKAITYNELGLVLNPDDTKLEVVKYKPVTESIRNAELDRGILMRTAKSMHGLTNMPLRWEFRLDHPPRRFLNYFFMNGSLTPSETENRHNVVESRIPTQQGTKFSSKLAVELTIREDGTTTPKFIYGTAGGTEISVEAQPFALDMTFSAEETGGAQDCYLGFDFGTSNSSFSYVSQADVQKFELRASNDGWVELSDLLSSNRLPYPIAYPLAQFMAETSSDGMEKWGRETVEACLTTAAYIMYSEYCASPGQLNSALFKSLAHRSAGPLWGFIKQLGPKLKSDAPFSGHFLNWLSEPHRSFIENLVNAIPDEKHGRANSLDYPTTLRFLCNQAATALAGRTVGLFEGVVKRGGLRRARFEGVFRVLSGASRPFYHIYNYNGHEAMLEGAVYICDLEKRLALSLTPWMLYTSTTSKPEDAELFIFDGAKRDVPEFKAVPRRAALVLDNPPDEFLREVAECIGASRQRDMHYPITEGVTLTDPSSYVDEDNVASVSLP